MVGNLAECIWYQIYKNFDNETCRRCYQEVHACKRSLSRPQPIPYIGSNFYDNEKRLMFIGIESYGNEPKRSSVEDLKPDIFKTELVEDLFFDRKEKTDVPFSPFWNWVRIISTDVLAPQKLAFDDRLNYAFSRIAYSNLHKCENKQQNGNSNISTYEIFEPLSRNCIQKARWIYREIETVNPTHTIVFAGSKRSEKYSCFLARLFLNYGGKNIKPYAGSKRYFLIKAKDNKRKFIVTNHPRGTITEIRDEIIRIIKENDWDDAEQINITGN